MKNLDKYVLPTQCGQLTTSDTVNHEFIQLYDRNYSNILKTTGQYLNLSDTGIDPMYMEGDFFLTTTTVKNDTLNIVEPGIYQFTINFEASFNLTEASQEGKLYDISFHVVDQNNLILDNLYYRQVIPEEKGKPLYHDLGRSFLWNSTANSKYRIRLCQFDFELAELKELYAYNIIFIVNKLKAMPC